MQRHQLFLSLAILGCLGWNPTFPGYEPSRNEHVVMAVLWTQSSAEFRALSYQAFNVARQRLDEDRTSSPGKKKKAVVVDIDETVLDNSPHAAHLIEKNEVFPFAWREWVDRAEAQALPGAREFLEYAVSQGYDVFYVSNRSDRNEKEGTLRNLRARGFPQVSEEHLLLQTDESSKDRRRKRIHETHEIVLLIGDNLNDLATVFEKKPIDERLLAVDDRREEFGARFIVLPNPVYGEWEAAVYGYQRGLNDEQKNRMRKERLRGF